MSRKATDDIALETEIGRLPDLSLGELRERWKTLFGHPVPKSLRRNFLARAVAYQIKSRPSVDYRSQPNAGSGKSPTPFAMAMPAPCSAPVASSRARR
jgi:hypothetical protein